MCSLLTNSIWLVRKCCDLIGSEYPILIGCCKPFLMGWADSGLFVCDRFFTFGNNRLFPERGSFISGPEMKGARFNMAINICNFSFELLCYEVVYFIFMTKVCGTCVALLKCCVCSTVIILCDRSEMTSSEWFRFELGLTMSLILMTNTEIRKHGLIWLAFPAVAPGDFCVTNGVTLHRRLTLVHKCVCAGVWFTGRP